MNTRENDPLQSFKAEIQAMFQKNFQELALKNNLNKTILANLTQAARDQQRKINQLDKGIEAIRNNMVPQSTAARGELAKHEERIHEDFNSMMARLSQVQQGITHSRKGLQHFVRNSAEIGQKLDGLTRQLEVIEMEQGGYQYKGTQQDLIREVEEFQKMLTELDSKSRGISNQLDFAHKTSLQQPLSSFETKMTLHNRNNQQVLKVRLRQFNQRLNRVQRKVQDTANSMRSEFGKSGQEQRRIIQEMQAMQAEAIRLRGELEGCEERRRQTMQSRAVSLDNIVEQMLSQAKKLEVRVQQLRKGYQSENNKMRGQMADL